MERNLLSEIEILLRSGEQVEEQLSFYNSDKFKQILRDEVNLKVHESSLKQSESFTFLVKNLLDIFMNQECFARLKRIVNFDLFCYKNILLVIQAQFIS